MTNKDSYRELIDDIDQQIIELIGERNDTVTALHLYKRSINDPLWDQQRVDEVIDVYVESLGQIDGIRIATAIIGTQEQLEQLADE